MTRAVGAADEFWRVRVTRMDTPCDPDLDWRDDVLYRRFDSDCGQEPVLWHVEAVATDDPDVVARIATFDSPADAESLLEEVTAALKTLSRSQFEAAYVRRQGRAYADDLPDE